MCSSSLCRRSCLLFVSAMGIISTLHAQIQETSWLDSALMKRSSNPEFALTIARKAQSSSDISVKGQSLLLQGILLSDLGLYDSSFALLDEALPLFESLEDEEHIADVYDNMGLAKEFQSNFTAALAFYQDALQIRKRLGNLAKEAATLNNMANVYLQQSKYSESLDLYYRTLAMAEVLKDKKLISNAYNNIGTVFDYSNEATKAIEYYQLALKGYEDLNDDMGLAGTLNNIGLVFKNSGKPEMAIEHYRRALEIYLNHKHPYGTAVLQNNLGVAYVLMRKPEIAMKFHKQALATNQLIGNIDGIANSNNSIASCYFMLGDHIQAEQHFYQGLQLAKSIESLQRQEEALAGLSEIKEKLGDYQSALIFFKQADELRDSLLSIEKFGKLYELQEKYESSEKARQIAELSTEKEKQKVSLAEQQQLISRRNVQLTLAVSAIIVIGLMLYLWYMKLLFKQKVKISVMQHEQEQKMLHRIYEQRMSIAKDMHDEIGSGLTHIAMITEMVSVSIVDHNVRKNLFLISDTSRNLIQNMSDIIWAINPNNESLENLVAYLREQTMKYFEPFAIIYRFNVDTSLPDINLTNMQRRNLFLVTKEALNNALKHAHASTIELAIRWTNGELCFSVRDDGCGFTSSVQRKNANGLYNMRTRMQDINGKFNLETTENGTFIFYGIEVSQPV